MKKNIIQIIVLVALAGLIIGAQFAPYGTSRLFDMLKIGKKATIKELRDFSIEDTARVDRIFMVDKENEKVDLIQKANNQWYVNNRYPAKTYSVNLLLKTMHRMRIKNPVARSAEENIIKRLATKSVKVEVYDGDDILKTYYIGGVTQSQTGTFAMLKGSSKPFVIEIPGFRGYLSSRFHTDSILWRSTKIYKYNAEQIDKIDVAVGDKPGQSFSVKVKGRSQYELFNNEGEKAVKFDTLAVRRFVKEFRNKSFTRFITAEPRFKTDSIYNSPFFYKFNLKLNNQNKATELSLHRMKNYQADDITEIDYLNGIIDQNTWVRVQTHIFATMFKELDDFRPHF